MSLQVGSVSSLIARIPWPNPLSSTLGFSIDSLHLTFIVRPPSSLDAKGSLYLADSVASIAESFVHDELSLQEEVALRKSMHPDVSWTQSKDDPSVPGGILADPFLFNPDESTYPDLDPSGVSIFATLIERLLARFEFDATNTKVTLVHPDNMSITGFISDVRYRTDNSRGAPRLSPDTSHFCGQQRTISISGLTFSTRNLRSEIYPGVYTPTGHLPSLSNLPCSSSPTVSPSSSLSSMDEEAQFAMSQSLASLPPRPSTSSNSAASSMYQSAISSVPACMEKGVDLLAEQGWSRTSSPVAPAVDSPDILLPHNHSSDHHKEETLVSFGSTPLVFHINTPSPLASAEGPSVPRQERFIRQERPEIVITHGVIACALQAWQLRGLLDLVRDLPSQFDKNDSKTQPHNAFIDFKLVFDLRGLVVLLPLPSSSIKTADAPSLTDFFKWPLVPPVLPHSYARLYIEAVSASFSSVPGSADSSPLEDMKEVTGTCTLGDISLFYIHGSPNIVRPCDLIVSPLLITDPGLTSQYDLCHKHPSENSLDPNLPTFGLTDWTADDQLTNGLKLSSWRTKSTRRPNIAHRVDPTVISPSALILTARYRIASSVDDLQELSSEIQVKLVPLHIFLDLGIILCKDEISTFLANSYSAVDRSSNQVPKGDASGDNNSDGTYTPPASSNTWDTQQRGREKTKLEKPALKNLHPDLNYSINRATSRSKKQRLRKVSYNTAASLAQLNSFRTIKHLTQAQRLRSHSASYAFRYDARLFLIVLRVQEPYRLICITLNLVHRLS